MSWRDFLVSLIMHIKRSLLHDTYLLHDKINFNLNYTQITLGLNVKKKKLASRLRDFSTLIY